MKTINGTLLRDRVAGLMFGLLFILFTSCNDTAVSPQIPAIHLHPLPDTTLFATELLDITVSVDEHAPGQVFFTSPSLPQGATLDSITGRLRWQTTVADTMPAKTIVLRAYNQVSADTIVYTIRVLSINAGSDGLRLLSPVGGEAFAVGDTMHIIWSTDFAKVENGVIFGISPNKGKSWVDIRPPTDALIQEGDQWYQGTLGRFDWIVKDSLESSLGKVWNLCTSECILKVEAPYDQVLSQTGRTGFVRSQTPTVLTITR
jgi:hypothetical protein